MEFREYAALPDERLGLLTGALLVAKDAYPSLDFAAQEATVRELAAPLGARRLEQLPAAAQAEALAEYLYLEQGFRGNEHDYYDPENSFLNQVLARRTGIPITMAVVYVEVAQRAGVAAQGVAFPGHFLVRIDGADAPTPVFVDPFHGGLTLDVDGLSEMLVKSGAPPLRATPGLLEPATVRAIIARMLMNLRSIYALRGDDSRLLVTLDHLIDLDATAAEEIRDRGLLAMKLRAPVAALADLERYLRLAPRADDAERIRALAELLTRKARQAQPS